MDHVFKTDALLTHTVKTAIVPEELAFVFNALPQPTESSPYHNTLVFARKVTMMTRESANHADQDVPNAQMLPLVKDVLSQLPTTTMELVHAHKVISSLLIH